MLSTHFFKEHVHLTYKPELLYLIIFFPLNGVFLIVFYNEYYMLYILHMMAVD